MSDHEWCRDVQRDEAVRAAEDAAAVPAIQHRDLPEQVALLWASVGDLIGRVVRLEGEMDAGADLTAERDAALRERDAAKEECERLRAERDDALLVLPACCGRLSDAAATVVQERDHARSRVAELLADCDTFERAALALQGQLDRALARVAELEAAPPPRGWMTAEEREAVEKCLRHFVRQEIDFLERNDPGHRWLEVWRREEAILRALLARETPPRVRRPNPNVVFTTVDARERIDRQWIAAIRAAGGEVE